MYFCSSFSFSFMVVNSVIYLTEQFNWLRGAAQHWRRETSVSNPGLLWLWNYFFYLSQFAFFSWTWADVIFVFVYQEQQRYNQPHKAFTFRMHGFESVVGPVKGVFDKEMSLNKAREHTLLRSDRPPYVTILSLGQAFCWTLNSIVRMWRNRCVCSLETSLTSPISLL